MGLRTGVQLPPAAVHVSALWHGQGSLPPSAAGVAGFVKGIGVNLDSRDADRVPVFGVGVARRRWPIELAQALTRPQTGDEYRSGKVVAGERHVAIAVRPRRTFVYAAPVTRRSRGYLACDGPALR